MNVTFHASRFDEMARQDARVAAARKRSPLVEELPELALALIVALLLSLICC